MVDFVVRDYLAAREVKIRVDGLTVLRGESYSGKSSTFRAIQSACMNRFASGTVRWGAPQSEVAIRFDGGDILKVVKANTGGASYELGGVKYDKTRREVPAEVESFLNLGTLTSGADKLSLTFWEQFSRPLLRSFSQAKVSEMLGSGTALRDWGVCWKELSSRRSELRGEEKMVRSYLDDARAEAVKYEQLFKDGKSLYDSVREYSTALTAHKLRTDYLKTLHYHQRLLVLMQMLSIKRDSEALSLTLLSSTLQRLDYLRQLKRILLQKMSLEKRISCCVSLSRIVDGSLHYVNRVGFAHTAMGYLTQLRGLHRESFMINTQKLCMQEELQLLDARLRLLRLRELQRCVMRLNVAQGLFGSATACAGVLDRLHLIQLLKQFRSDLVGMAVRRDHINAHLADGVCPLCGSTLVESFKTVIVR